MDRHACKLCFRRFSNGRALGGHMRSHAQSSGGATTAGGLVSQLIEHSASPSSSSSASQADLEVTLRVAQVAGEEAKQQLLSYGLRENPKKSFRLVDPEFSPAGGCSSAVVQDWESETESSVPPSHRRRSQRRRRVPPPSPPKSEPSLEPVSSVSDTTPDEDVARCLMMLSRDAWTIGKRAAPAKRSISGGATEEDEEEQESDEEGKSRIVAKLRRGGRGKYQCGTCGKVFRSYQALGGHRASHKKIRTGLESPLLDDEEEDDDTPRRWERQIHDGDSEVNAGRRIHECPVCFRVFSSGQALGGHKRSHVISSTSSAAHHPTPVLLSNVKAAAARASDTHDASPVRASKPAGESLLDLNQPPPMDEEEELSAVSDGQQYK